MILHGAFALTLAVLITTGSTFEATRDCHCPAPRAPRHGIKVLFDNGRLVRYSCHPGFVLKGEHQVVCLGDQWSAPPPECLATPGTPAGSGAPPLPLIHGKWPPGAPGSTEREIIVSPADRPRVEDELRIASLRRDQEDSVRRSRGEDVKQAPTPSFIQRRTKEGYHEENSHHTRYSAVYRSPTSIHHSSRPYISAYKENPGRHDASSKQLGSSQQPVVNSTSHQNVKGYPAPRDRTYSRHSESMFHENATITYDRTRHTGRSNVTRGNFQAFSKNKESYYRTGGESSSQSIPKSSGQPSNVYNYYNTYKLPSPRPDTEVGRNRPLNYHPEPRSPEYATRLGQGRRNYESKVPTTNGTRHHSQVKGSNRESYAVSKPLWREVKSGTRASGPETTEKPRINVNVRVIPSEDIMTGRRRDGTRDERRPSGSYDRTESFGRRFPQPSPEPLSVAREHWAEEKLERQEGESPLRQENEFNTSTEKTKELVNESWLSRLSPELRHRFLAKLEAARRERPSAHHRPAVDYWDARGDRPSAHHQPVVDYRDARGERPSAHHQPAVDYRDARGERPSSHNQPAVDYKDARGERPSAHHQPAVDYRDGRGERPSAHHQPAVDYWDARGERHGAHHRPAVDYRESTESYKRVAPPTPNYIRNYHRRQSYELSRFKNSREDLREDSQNYRKSSRLRTSPAVNRTCNLDMQRAPYIPHGFVSEYRMEEGKLVALYRCVQRFILADPVQDRLICHNGSWTAHAPPKCLRQV